MPGRARHDGFRAGQPAPVTYEPGMTARTEPAGSPPVTPDLFRGPLSGEASDVEIESVAVTVRAERSRSTAPPAFLGSRLSEPLRGERWRGRQLPTE